MKIETPGTIFSAFKDFYDFTSFSKAFVLPGETLTPLDRTKRGRIAPFRKRMSRSPLAAWERVLACRSKSRAAKASRIEPTHSVESAETDARQWASRARHARLCWMEENPY
jgi:hypothetical protein